MSGSQQAEINVSAEAGVLAEAQDPLPRSLVLLCGCRSLEAPPTVLWLVAPRRQFRSGMCAFFEQAGVSSCDFTFQRPL